jgi:hypothetical protein
MQKNTTYTPVLKAQFNYSFLKYLDAGFYTGYTSIKSETEPVIISETPPIGYQCFIVNSDVLFYGINANFHIIPLIFNKKTYPFDIYIQKIVLYILTRKKTVSRKTILLTIIEAVQAF